MIIVNYGEIIIIVHLQWTEDIIIYIHLAVHIYFQKIGIQIHPRHQLVVGYVQQEQVIKTVV